MLIQKHLLQITVIIVAFSLLLLLGLFQTAKGAKLHQLNFLHIKYTSELNSVLAQGEDEAQIAHAKLHDLLTNIRAQPLACLELINSFDKMMMSLIGTAHAITLCHEDANTANTALYNLKRYNQRKISQQELYQELKKSSDIFTEHSAKFEKPVRDTVNFIVTSTLLPLSLLSLFVVLFFCYAAKKITNTVDEMHETADALAESEERNRMLAHYDSLTGLPNRNLLQDRLAHQSVMCQRKKNSMALLFVDLDRFKNINDSMGHSAGDTLICQASDRIASLIRKSDTLARIGGDEFNIMLNDLSKIEDSSIVAKKILKGLAEPFDILGQKIFITACIGIAIYPNDSDDVNSLKKYADLAMHQAKKKGRNSLEFYSKELEEKNNAKLTMEHHLRHALENREFSLHYQPVVRLSDMQVVGAEALIRWHNAELGLVSPMDFIPLSEETGLILEIGDWVLQEACQRACEWRQKGNPDFKIAVNVSPRQLLSEHFLTSVHNALNVSQLPASALDIEITENIMIEEDSISLSILNELSKLNIHLLLDDFGTGHSSLSYLHRLPFDVLKVDRSFVMQLDNEEEKSNIVPSIIAMAHELNLSVIAEGVETDSASKTLQGLHCEYAQGYYFSRPVPAEEFDCNKNYKDA